MKYSGIVLSICLAFIGIARAGLSEVPAGATVTYQEWHFTTDANPAAPEVDENPMGDFPDLTARISGAAFFPDLRWEDGTWKDTALTITIDIPNNQAPNPYKGVLVQMLIKGDLVLSWIRDGQGNDFDRVSRLVEPVETDCDHWFLVTDEWMIEPNPNFERLCYGLNGQDGSDGMIDWIKVYTVCTPEPASLGFILAGGCWLVRLKRRG